MNSKGCLVVPRDKPQWYTTVMFLETHLKGKDLNLYHYFLKYVFQNTSAAGVRTLLP